MNEEKWTPDSAFAKAWSFVKYASGKAAKTKDPIGAYSFPSNNPVLAG
jgi:hypothetical protein